LSKVTQNESDTRRGPRAPRLQTDESAVKVLRRRPEGRETKREAVEVGGVGVGRDTHIEEWISNRVRMPRCWKKKQTQVVMEIRRWRLVVRPRTSELGEL